MFANLSRQLESFKEHGPPLIGKALMSEEDFRFKEYQMECGENNVCESFGKFHIYKGILKEAIHF